MAGVENRVASVTGAELVAFLAAEESSGVSGKAISVTLSELE